VNGRIVFDQDFRLAVSAHAHLRDVDLGCFRRRKKNVIVRGVLRIREFIGRETAAKMIAATRGDMDRAENFLVLDVLAGRRQLLRAEAELAECAGD